MDLIANIDVDDLALAERFYCDGLGLQVRRRFGGSGVELGGASASIFLLVKAAGSQPAATVAGVRDYRRHWTPVHLDFVVENLKQAVEQSIAAGAVQEQPIQTHAWGRIALMSDPFGHGYCLIEFSSRGYDAIASRD